MNDTIRVGRDGLVLSLWIMLGYGVVLTPAGLCLHVTRRLTTQRGPHASSPHGMGQLCAGVVFFVCFAFIFAFVHADSIWPEHSTFKILMLLAVLLAATGAAWACVRFIESIRPSPGMSRGAAIFALLSMVILNGSSYWIGESRAETVGAKITSIPRIENDRRVILLGVDGTEWGVLNRLVSEGRLPNFSRLLESSARSPLATLWPTYSPIIWTTIATGVGESSHGVRDFTELPIPGLKRNVQRLHTGPVILPPNVGLTEAVRGLVRYGMLELHPVTATHRRKKALWNIASEAGASSAVVSWYATYPVEPINGFLISDRNTVSFRQGAYEPLSGVPGLVFPPSLTDEIEQAGHRFPRTDPEEFLNHPQRETERGPPVESQVMSIARELDADHFAASAGLWLYEQYDVDLVAVYLPGIDASSHIFGEYYDFVAPRYYEYIDTWLGRYMDAADERTVLMVVSDHGWSYQSDNFGHNHAPDGVLIASGPGIAAGELTAQPSVTDIAPTILAMLGIAVARDLDGEVIDELLDGVSVTHTDTYGVYEPPSMDSSETTDDEGAQAIERLKALGYVGD